MEGLTVGMPRYGDGSGCSEEQWGRIKRLLSLTCTAGVARERDSAVSFCAPTDRYVHDYIHRRPEYPRFLCCPRSHSPYARECVVLWTRSSRDSGLEVGERVQGFLCNCGLLLQRQHCASWSGSDDGSCTTPSNASGHRDHAHNRESPSTITDSRPASSFFIFFFFGPSSSMKPAANTWSPMLPNAARSTGGHWYQFPQLSRDMRAWRWSITASSVSCISQRSTDTAVTACRRV